MRKSSLKIMVLAAWLGLPTLALAAGMDCGKAVATADKALCAIPGLARRDAAMNQAFERARARAGAHADNVARDQRNWLAARNRAGLLASSRPGDVRKSYDERIAFLNQVFKTPASPLLAAIAARAAVTPLADDDRNGGWAPWPAMGGDGSVFSLAQQAPENWLSSRFPANPVVQRILSDPDLDGHGDIGDVLTLDDVGVGGIKIVEGTLGCEEWALFGWKGQTLRKLATPAIFGPAGLCVYDHGDLASFKHRAYAVRTSTDDGGGGTTIYVAAQPQTGDGWGKAAGLTLIYDRVLTAPTFYCELDDCGALAELAGQALRRYDGGLGATELTGALSRDEEQDWAAMREDTDESASTEWQWPYSGDEAAEKAIGFSPWAHFGHDAEYFPLRWQGELLLGRIGHEYTQDEVPTGSWLLAVWRDVDGKGFTSVLGMSASVGRGDFLLAVPSRP